MELAEVQDVIIEYQGRKIEYMLTDEGTQGLLAGMFCMEECSKPLSVQNLLNYARPSPVVLREFMSHCPSFLGRGVVTLHRNCDTDAALYPFVTYYLKDEVDAFLDEQEHLKDFNHPYFIVLAKERVSVWQRGEESRVIEAYAFQFQQGEYLIGLEQAYLTFGMDYREYVIGGEYPI